MAHANVRSAASGSRFPHDARAVWLGERIVRLPERSLMHSDGQRPGLELRAVRVFVAPPQAFQRIGA